MCGSRCWPVARRKSEREQLLSRDRRGRSRCVMGTHAVIQDAVRVQELGSGGDRRTAQIRRAATGRTAAGRAIAALSGDDGDADSAHDDDDAVRRSGYFDARANCPAGGSRSTPIWSNPTSRRTGGNSSATACAKAGRRMSSRRSWTNRQRSRHRASRRRLSNSPTANSKRSAWRCCTAGCRRPRSRK